MLSLLRAWVQSLVRELRSHKLWSEVKKKKKKDLDDQNGWVDKRKHEDPEHPFLRRYDHPP